ACVRRGRASAARAPPGRSMSRRARRGVRARAGGGSSPTSQAADPERIAAGHGSAAAGGILHRRLLGLLAVLDDVALLEQDALGDLAPQRRAPQQELQIHGEVLELLPLG